MSTRPTVLFLCVHNAGRSQMAAGYLRHQAGDRITVLSAGSAPGTQVNPAAIEAMAEIGIDISRGAPKKWTDDMARSAHAIITMGCGDECPVYPGTYREDWALTDPAGQSIEVVRHVRDEICGRVDELVERLLGSPVARPS